MKLGIAPRRFYGWEPKRTVRYVHDEDGRITGAVEELEPEWDEEQRELATAWQAVDRETGRYGEDLLIATSPEADPANKAASYRYVAGVDAGGMRVPLVNHAEKAAQDAMDPYYKKHPEALEHKSSHVWPVQLVELG